MILKTLFHWLYKKIYTYNVFIPEENDYDDEIQDPTIVLRHQRYASRLYIVLLAVFFYILFSTILMNPQSRTSIVSSVNLEVYNQLYFEHNETLSCPCSQMTIIYRDFVSSSIQLHPVCKSTFVTQPWINALYFPNASIYGVADFRTTANAQV
ncbi:hypothetical protein I4U23_025700 [Adineta vaga]|nr:hypothetical protein I4U23_025700 [Adineta vaga]